MPKLPRISLYTLETVYKILSEVDANPNQNKTFIERKVRSIDHDSFDSHYVRLLNQGLLYFPTPGLLKISRRGQDCLSAFIQIKNLLNKEPPSTELEKLGMRPHTRYATKKDMDWMRYEDEQYEQRSHEPDSMPKEGIHSSL